MRVLKEKPVVKPQTSGKPGSFDAMAANLKQKVQGAEDDTSTRSAQRVLGAHINTASEAGKRVKAKILECDPARLRMWDGHDRDYGLLNEELCKDLIDGFERTGQQIPVIARKSNDDKYDYEIICGARRHWTSTYRNKTKKESLLVHVRALDDEQAFLLQDSENRDREDVSAYERAISFSRALDSYFGGVNRRMAERLDMDYGNFNRLLSLAELPMEIVEAYGDRRDLVVDHMKSYKSLLADDKAKARMITEAKAIKRSNRTINGKEVVNRIRTAGQGGDKVSTKAKKVAPEGSVLIKRAKTGEFTIKIKPGKDKSSTLKSIKAELTEFVAKLESEYS